MQRLFRNNNVAISLRNRNCIEWIFCIFCQPICRNAIRIWIIIAIFTLVRTGVQSRYVDILSHSRYSLPDYSNLILKEQHPRYLKKNNFFVKKRRELPSSPSVVLDGVAGVEDVIIATKNGRLRGFRQTYENIHINTFLGVPYVEKPVGKRRFGLPQPLQPWNGEFAATTTSKTCYFTIDTMFPQFPGAEMWNPPNELDEDCLSLNIWTPTEKHDGTVLVWIYGGGFFSGSPSLDLYDGRVLASKERVIVVNINYRLGPFGFLFFGRNSKVPGNMGLMDQQLALKWVHENIGYFGGDPEKVTLFGESAGGASVSAHLFAPGSRNYFKRLIIKSGTIINNWATKSPRTILNISLNLAHRLNCSLPRMANENEYAPNNNEIDRILKCMSNLSSFVIQKEADEISELLTVPMTFAFVPINEDGHFFQGNLFEKLRARNFKKNVSVMMGTVKDEGTYWLPYYLYKYGFSFNHTISAEDHNNQALISQAEYVRAFDAFMPYFGGSPLVRHALLNAYIDESLMSKTLSEVHRKADGIRIENDITAALQNNTEAVVTDAQRRRNGVARFLGDYFFTCALIDFGDVLSSNIFGAVYMYYFNKRSSANPWPKWMGVMHGYEIEYVFGVPFRQKQLYAPTQLEAERNFSRHIMDLFSRFAKSGQPVDYWPKYNTITRISMFLGDSLLSSDNYYTYNDAHGETCHLIQEAQTVIKNNQKLPLADALRNQTYVRSLAVRAYGLSKLLIIIISMLLHLCNDFILL